jgi:hypothetical protein
MTDSQYQRPDKEKGTPKAPEEPESVLRRVTKRWPEQVDPGRMNRLRAIILQRRAAKTKD